jgi:hypothetical protein
MPNITMKLAEAANDVPEDIQHFIVLQAIDGLLENAEEDALIGGLRDRAPDIAACLQFRDYYTTAYGITEEENQTETCGRCGATITRGADGAWEDEKGACGCGDDEHDPGATPEEES